MKRFKHLCTQKNKGQQQTQKIQSFKSFHNQTIKTLQNYYRDCHLNPQPDLPNKKSLQIIQINKFKASHQYFQSKSQKTKSINETLPQSNQTKYFKNKFQFQTSSANIRKLLRIKTVAESTENERLRNPFYKIQKARLDNKNFSLSDKKGKFSSKQSLRQISLNRKKQEESKIFSPLQILEKTDCLTEKKCQSRKVGIDEMASVKKRQTSVEAEVDHFNAEDTFQQKILRENSNKNQGQISEFSIKKHKLKRFQPIETQQQMKQKRVQSPLKIRQKSLTVKYNEIKDYFEKKYVKNHTLQAESLQDDFSK